jgi:hypothetical protein
MQQEECNCIAIFEPEESLLGAFLMRETSSSMKPCLYLPYPSKETSPRILYKSVQ